LPRRTLASCAIHHRARLEHDLLRAGAVNDVELIPLREVQRRHVLQVLEVCGGNRTEAARILGVDRKTLYRKLQKWGAASPE
jgi:DNA-binding NtrC family response regulator